MPKSRTLPSRQRSNVLNAYRSRGRSNRNLWLVYSLKTNRDWILRSDRHLVHWILCLESDPTVQTFELDPSAPDFGATNRHGVVSDAFVVRADGAREHHKLVLSQSQANAANSQNDVVSDDGLPVRIFMEADLGGRGAEAMRWLKLLCYCAAIRDEGQSEATLAAIKVTHDLGAGTVLQILQAMRDFDHELSLGVIGRLAIMGDIALDLSAAGFTGQSRWERRFAR